MKVLISAASRHGATRGIARAIERALEEAGLEVDLIEPEHVTSVAPYDAVILGSGVYAGSWLRPARELIERHAAGLAGKRVWLFSSGPIGESPKPVQEPPDGVKFKAQLQAIDHVVFAGKVDPATLSFGEKGVMRIVSAPTGDFRPWDAINEWAHEIAGALSAAVGSAPVGAGSSR